MQKSKSRSNRRASGKKAKPATRAGKAGKHPQKQRVSLSRLKKAEKSPAMENARKAAVPSIQAKTAIHAKSDPATETGAMKFATLKNYPTSKSYEAIGKKAGFFEALLSRLGMKK